MKLKKKLENSIPILKIILTNSNIYSLGRFNIISEVSIFVYFLFQFNVIYLFFSVEQNMFGFLNVELFLVLEFLRFFIIQFKQKNIQKVYLAIVEKYSQQLLFLLQITTITINKTILIFQSNFIKFMIKQNKDWDIIILIIIIIIILTVNLMIIIEMTSFYILIKEVNQLLKEFLKLILYMECGLWNQLKYHLIF